MRPICVGQDDTMSRIWAASPSLRSAGKLNSTMCCKVMAQALLVSPWSVELEVLAHLPVADVLPVGRRVLGNCRFVPGNLRALHLQQVVDQNVAEGLAEEFVPLQRVQSFGQRRRERGVVRGVRVGLN